VFLLIGIGAAVGESEGHSPSTTSPSTTSPSSQTVQSWWNAAGASEQNTLAADLNQLVTDSNNQDAASMEADGSTLATDAGNALSDPLPPADPGDWQAMLQELQTAGNDMSNGNFSQGSSDLTDADNSGHAFTTAVSSLAPALAPLLGSSS
jgi:hypothetical protein